MGRKSSIKSLPKDILERLNFLIGEGALRLDDLTDWLDEQGHPRSRSAIGRHAQQVKKLGDRLRQTRELVNGLGRELGELGEGKTGRLLVESLRSLVFDMLVKMDDGETLEPKDFHFMARSLKDLASAARLDQDFELKVRQELAAKLDAAVEEASKVGEKGLSAERVKQLREEFLGVRKSAA